MSFPVSLYLSRKIRTDMKNSSKYLRQNGLMTGVTVGIYIYTVWTYGSKCDKLAQQYMFNLDDNDLKNFETNKQFYI